jgi:hypothetical protein
MARQMLRLRYVRRIEPRSDELSIELIDAPAEIRTPDPLVRNQVLVKEYLGQTKDYYC